MIRLYRKVLRDKSTEKVETWLKSNNIAYNVIFPSMVTEELVYSMLKVSDCGFKDILVSHKRAQKRWQNLKIESDLNDFTIQKMVSLIVKNPQILKFPIIFDEKHLLSGFNADEIRAFLPRSHRVMINES